MVSIKALDTLTPADLWREVPLVEEFWEEAQERQCRVLKVLLEETLEDEQLELLARRETPGRHESLVAKRQRPPAGDLLLPE